jgi:hypothetical protein
MLRPPVPQLVGGCTDKGMRKYNTTFATNIATERPASDHASQELARLLIPMAPRPCSLGAVVTTLL